MTRGRLSGKFPNNSECYAAAVAGLLPYEAHRIGVTACLTCEVTVPWAKFRGITNATVRDDRHNKWGVIDRPRGVGELGSLSARLYSPYCLAFTRSVSSWPTVRTNTNDEAHRTEPGRPRRPGPCSRCSRRGPAAPFWPHHRLPRVQWDAVPGIGRRHPDLCHELHQLLCQPARRLRPGRLRVPVQQPQRHRGE